MRSILFKTMAIASTCGALIAGCSDDDPVAPEPTTFTVKIENVSQPNTLATDRVNGTVPLSPGAYAIYQGTNPIFVITQPADEGLERIAEDGMAAVKVAALESVANVDVSGMFSSPGGADNGPIITSGEMATFTVTASPGDRLQIATMFAQSNDWFYSFGENGLALFNGNTPINGDMTSNLVLYDAGTEEDTAPGTGPYQATAQEPGAMDVGPDDDNTQIRNASTDGFTIPPTTSVIRVTITPSS